MKMNYMAKGGFIKILKVNLIRPGQGLTNINNFYH